MSRAWYNLSALRNAIKLIHLVCTYSPELWQSPSSRQFHWKDQFRQTPKHLYGYLTIPTCLRIEIKFSLNEKNYFSKKFKISFRMNDVIFLLRSSSDQLLYNVEQLLSTKKKKNSACSTELNDVCACVSLWRGKRILSHLDVRFSIILLLCAVSLRL